MYRILLIIIPLVSVTMVFWLPLEIDRSISNPNLEKLFVLTFSQLFILALMIVAGLYLHRLPNIRSSFRLLFALSSLGLIVQAITALSVVANYQTHKDMVLSVSYSDYGEFELSSTNVAKLDGYIGPGTLSSLRKLVYRNDLHYVEVNSGGGLIDEAIEIGETLRIHSISVYVRERCFSACVIVATSGPKLYANRNASFGFHQGSAITSIENQYTKYIGLTATESLLAALMKRGVPKDILESVEGTPSSSMFYYSGEELHSFGVVDEIVR